VGNVLLVIDDPFSDTTPPTTTASESPTPTNGWNSSPVAVTLNATDNQGGSGVASITFAINGGLPVTLQGSSVLLPQISTEGVSIITFHATDRAGNVEADNTLTVKIDQTPPTLTLPSNLVVEATGPSGTPVNFSWSATDSLSGVYSTFIDYPSGYVFPLGQTTVHVTAQDLAGNISKGSFMVTVRDTTPPALTLPSPIVAEATGPMGPR
jgi:hypothetical protein